MSKDSTVWNDLSVRKKRRPAEFSQASIRGPTCRGDKIDRVEDANPFQMMNSFGIHIVP